MTSFIYKGLRYWNTLRYLRFVQISGRIKYKFKKTRVDLSDFHGTKVVSNGWTQPAKRLCRMVNKNEFCFLNERHTVVSKKDWNNEQCSKLWLYNLHYFDDLGAADAVQRRDWHRSLIHCWIHDNPPAEGNGWEPYPCSLRIVNWIKWSLAGNVLEGDWCYSLVVQIRFLTQNLETHLLGNHLFSNAKALIFAGLFFQGDEAHNWYETGKRLIERELMEQVLADGGHFELSTMYHALFLEDLLDLVNVHRTFGFKSLLGVENVIPKVILWLATMCHPDGEISFFNDAALGVTAPVSELYNYAERLGFRVENSFTKLIDLRDSGYSRVSLSNAVLLIDRASVGAKYLPGHAHADTLSFELSIFHQRVIVNSGTSIYGTGAERHRQRGTAAHSTVVIDGENSSEVWSGFRVARRASVSKLKSVESSSYISLSACHDGYNRLRGRPVHRRDWRVSEGALEIQDWIFGGGTHNIVVGFPLHPDVEITSLTTNKVVLAVAQKKVNITWLGSGILEQEQSTYHPEFGHSIDNIKLVYKMNAQLPAKIITRIYW